MSRIGPKRALFNTVAPSIPSGGDPYWNNVTLLLNNTSGVLTDSSQYNHNVSNQNLNGSSSVITSTGQLLNPSVTPSSYYDGYSYLQAPYGVGLGSGDYTVEGWFYLTSYTGLHVNQSLELFMIRNSVSTEFFVGYGGDADSNFGKMNFVVGDTYPTDYSKQPTLPLNTWTHIAATRTGSLNTLWVNGSSTLTLNYSGDPNYSGAHFCIGYAEYHVYDSPFRGYANQIRVTQGVCRYTSTFTPTFPYPTY